MTFSKEAWETNGEHPCHIFVPFAAFFPTRRASTEEDMARARDCGEEDYCWQQQADKKRAYMAERYSMRQFKMVCWKHNQYCRMNDSRRRRAVYNVVSVYLTRRTESGVKNGVEV